MQQSMEADQDNSAFAYDRIPYPGAVETHINLLNLEVVAAMFGFPVPDTRKSRVLEIGCANGTNLLPMASEFPDSQFVGVDPVEDRITEARMLAEQAGLENVELRAESLSDLDGSIGEFDFILVPGVYSWVTDQERNDLLQLSGKHLSPNGLVVISYNTYPGWKWTEAIREFVRQHVDSSYSWRDQVTQAKAIVDHIAQHAPKSMQKTFYASAQETFRGFHEPYLYHEYLAELNQPFYFHEFEQQIGDHGLMFLAEADFRQSSGFGLEPDARRAVLEAPPEKRQPLLDMLLNTSYRKSIVCRADQEVVQPDAKELLSQYWISLGEKVDPESIDLDSDEPVNLDYAHGNVSTNDALTKRAIKKLAESWPRAMRLEKLSFADNEIESVSQSLFALYGASFIRLFKQPPRVASELSEKPSATPVSRCMAALKGPVASQWHQQVNGLTDLQRQLLMRLDGTVTRDAVQAELIASGATADQVQEAFEHLLNSRLLVD